MLKKLKNIVIVFGILGLGISFPALGRSNIDYREIEIILDREDKNEAIRQAIDQISVELVKNFIGEDKYEKNKDKVESKIIKNKNRYVLITKTAPSETQEDGKIMIKVILGVSKVNLQAVLLEHNLYYSSDQALCILPIVYFTIQKEKKSEYFWWKDSLNKQDYLPQKVASLFFTSLSNKLLKNGFYTVDPIFSRTHEGTPHEYLPQRNRVSSFMKLAHFLNCGLIMSGHAVFYPLSEVNQSYKSEFSLKIFNTQTKTVLFELNKKIHTVRFNQSFDSDMKDLFNSLNYQLGLYKNSGSLELNKLFLSIQGLERYHDAERLRKRLIQNLKFVKDLKERIITSQKITYEVDASSETSSIIKALTKIKIPGFSIQIINYNKKQIEIYAQPTKRKRK